MLCIECQKEIPDGARVCPYCSTIQISFSNDPGTEETDLKSEQNISPDKAAVNAAPSSRFRPRPRPRPGDADTSPAAEQSSPSSRRPQRNTTEPMSIAERRQRMAAERQSMSERRPPRRRVNTETATADQQISDQANAEPVSDTQPFDAPLVSDLTGREAASFVPQDDSAADIGTESAALSDSIPTDTEAASFEISDDTEKEAIIQTAAAPENDDAETSEIKPARPARPVRPQRPHRQAGASGETGEDTAEKPSQTEEKTEKEEIAETARPPKREKTRTPKPEKTKTPKPEKTRTPKDIIGALNWPKFKPYIALGLLVISAILLFFSWAGVPAHNKDTLADLVQNTVDDIDKIDIDKFNDRFEDYISSTDVRRLQSETRDLLVNCSDGGLSPIDLLTDGIHLSHISGIAKQGVNNLADAYRNNPAYKVNESIVASVNNIDKKTSTATILWGILLGLTAAGLILAGIGLLKKKTILAVPYMVFIILIFAAFAAIPALLGKVNVGAFPEAWFSRSELDLIDMLKSASMKVPAFISLIFAAAGTALAFMGGRKEVSA